MLDRGGLLGSTRRPHGEVVAAVTGMQPDMLDAAYETSAGDLGTGLMLGEPCRLICLQTRPGQRRLESCVHAEVLFDWRKFSYLDF